MNRETPKKKLEEQTSIKPIAWGVSLFQYKHLKPPLDQDANSIKL